MAKDPKSNEAKPNEVEELKAQLAAKDKELAEAKAKLTANAVAARPASEVSKKLLAAACEAWDIPGECVAASGMGEDGAVVIVTVGGAKVRWHEGDKPEGLSPEMVDGKSRKPGKGRK